MTSLREGPVYLGASGVSAAKRVVGATLATASTVSTLLNFRNIGLGILGPSLSFDKYSWQSPEASSVPVYIFCYKTVDCTHIECSGAVHMHRNSAIFAPSVLKRCVGLCCADANVGFWCMRSIRPFEPIAGLIC